MSLDNILSPDAIQKKQRFATREFSSFLNSEKFEYDYKDFELVSSFYNLFLGGFYAAKDEAKSDVINLDDAIQRMYFSALSSTNLLNKLDCNNFIFFHNFDNLNFKTSDYESNLRIVKGLSNQFKQSDLDLKKKAYSYFFNLSTFLNDNLSGFLNEQQTKNIKVNKYKSPLAVRSNLGVDDDSADTIENISFVKTHYDDIIGNVDAKDQLTESITKLFLYNSEKKKNPALEMRQFKQKYLLTGAPGNGKGMLAAYAATLSSKLAQDSNKKLNILTLDNNSTYQDGPVIKLINHLKHIDSKDDLYLIILDEVDSMFTTRLDHKTQNYQKKLVNELLKFTDNSVEYVNKGNYVMVAMTNNPTQLDPAFLSRMNRGTYVCEGPKTKDEKVLLMKNLIYSMVPEDKVKIRDWDAISDTAYALNLSGREIAGCVDNLFEHTAIKKTPFDLINKSYDAQLSFFNNFKDVTQTKVFDEILKTGERRYVENYLTLGGKNDSV